METEVLIIGGGTTGTGIARDLALRGIDCILLEQSDINSGASGGNHGLLHSGARYVFKDGETAAECAEEGELLKRLAPHCIEETGGLFVAVEGDEENYIADFPGMCEKLGIPVESVPVRQALESEPCLSDKAVSVFSVRDATIDPFMLSLDNLADAETHGSKVFRNAKITGFEIHKGTIACARIKDLRTGNTFFIDAHQYINSTGAWADTVARMAGAAIPMIYSKGSLVITQDRINRRVINRLRKTSDADIIAPGGTVSIAGTTSVEIDNLEDIRATAEEVDHIIKEGSAMVPELSTTRLIRAYAGVRPLVKKQNGSGRSITRNYTLMDHLSDGLDNFITITGGKLTTYRLMAEKTADMAAGRLNNDNPCLTRTRRLPKSAKGEWTEPGKSPKIWSSSPTAGDTLICECEMVSESMVDRIVEALKAEGAAPDIEEVGNRSRIGKGPCQGTFCSFRLAAYLYGKGELSDDQGIFQVRQFVNERWKGFEPLVRDKELMRVELQEAFLCDLFSLEHSNELMKGYDDAT